MFSRQPGFTSVAASNLLYRLRQAVSLGLPARHDDLIWVAQYGVDTDKRIKETLRAEDLARIRDINNNNHHPSSDQISAAPLSDPISEEGLKTQAKDVSAITQQHEFNFVRSDAELVQRWGVMKTPTEKEHLGSIRRPPTEHIPVGLHRKDPIPQRVVFATIPSTGEVTYSVWNMDWCFRTFTPSPTHAEVVPFESTGSLEEDMKIIFFGDHVKDERGTEVDSIESLKQFLISQMRTSAPATPQGTMEEPTKSTTHEEPVLNLRQIPKFLNELASEEPWTDAIAKTDVTASVLVRLGQVGKNICTALEEKLEAQECRLAEVVAICDSALEGAWKVLRAANLAFVELRGQEHFKMWEPAITYPSSFARPDLHLHPEMVIVKDDRDIRTVGSLRRSMDSDPQPDGRTKHKPVVRAYTLPDLAYFNRLTDNKWTAEGIIKRAHRRATVNKRPLPQEPATREPATQEQRLHKRPRLTRHRRSTSSPTRPRPVNIEIDNSSDEAVRACEAED